MLFSQEVFNINNFNKEIKNDLFKKAKAKFYLNLKSKSYGFINDLYEKKIEDIYSYSNKLKKAKNIIFLGTGGSSLGGKTLVSKNKFFKNTNKPQIFFLRNVDEVSIKGLLNQLNLEQTSIVVTSKSGKL